MSERRCDNCGHWDDSLEGPKGECLCPDASGVSREIRLTEPQDVCECWKPGCVEAFRILLNESQAECERLRRRICDLEQASRLRGPDVPPERERNYLTLVDYGSGPTYADNEYKHGAWDKPIPYTLLGWMPLPEGPEVGG